MISGDSSLIHVVPIYTEKTIDFFVFLWPLVRPRVDANSFVSFETFFLSLILCHGLLFIVSVHFLSPVTNEYLSIARQCPLPSEVLQDRKSTRLNSSHT